MCNLNFMNSKKPNKLTKKEITIIIDRLDYYEDFIRNLTHYVFKYFIDDGSFDTEDKHKFFYWCYNKVCDEYKKEGIDFSDNKELIAYLKATFDQNYFFPSEDEDKWTKKEILDYWGIILDKENIDKKSYLNVMVELYSLFNKTIEQKLEEYKKTPQKEEVKTI